MAKKKKSKKYYDPKDKRMETRSQMKKEGEKMPHKMSKKDKRHQMLKKVGYHFPMA